MKTFFILLLAVSFSACQKELSFTVDPMMNTELFKQFLTTDKKFRLVEFYSDMPIDFDVNDSLSVKETDLWNHVLYYLKDDENVFMQDGTLNILQNTETIPGDVSPLLVRSYSIQTVDNRVTFDFVDHNYQPFRYFLKEKGEDYFIIYTERDKAKLYTKFVVIE
ncbi:MAG TPA: hypothetical protein VM012_05370 [Flavitalea sp.]|nr:hypothetical protein [Flavitalea sp.]